MALVEIFRKRYLSRTIHLLLWLCQTALLKLRTYNHICLLKFDKIKTTKKSLIEVINLPFDLNKNENFWYILKLYITKMYIINNRFDSNQCSDTNTIFMGPWLHGKGCNTKRSTRQEDLPDKIYNTKKPKCIGISELFLNFELKLSPYFNILEKICFDVCRRIFLKHCVNIFRSNLKTVQHICLSAVSSFGSDLSRLELLSGKDFFINEALTQLFYLLVKS